MPACRQTRADLLFPLGTVDMIETFCDLADRRMEEAAATLTPTKTSARVRAVIALRLEQNRPYKEAVRRALAVLALPQNVRTAAALHQCSNSRRHLARRRLPLRRLHMVHQARDPGHDLQRDHPVLAA